jgi:hypothetical protein
MVRIVALVVGSAPLSWCGDTIDRASNCTELETAWRAAIVEVRNAAPSEVLGGIHDHVAERAGELSGEAPTRGADSEAELCQSIEDAAASERPFNPGSAERYFSRPPRALANSLNSPIRGLGCVGCQLGEKSSCRNPQPPSIATATNPPF